MKNIFYLSSILLLLKSGYLFSQSGNSPAGARSEGVANSSVAFTDVWSIFNNIGALANEKDLTIASSYSSIFQVEGFKNVALCANVPLSHFNTGVGIMYFGDNVYNEGRLSLGVGHKINFVSLGANLNYFQYNVIEFESEHAWVLEVGGLVQIHPALYFGAHVFNINQSTFSRSNQQIPTIMKAGISYLPIEAATFNFEIEKDPDKKTTLKSGLEYALVKQFLLRTGISTYPSKAHFGIGLLTRQGNIDYALSHHYRLGLSHQISANLKLKSKK